MLGDELRRTRQEKQMTQDQLSHTADVDRTYISELENNHRSPTVDVLLRLCKAMEVSAGTMVGRLEGLELAPVGSISVGVSDSGKKIGKRPKSDRR